MARFFALIACLMPLPLWAAEPLATGPSARSVAVKDGLEIEIFCQKPEQARSGPLFIVFHGVKRNAEDYRGFATRLGERHNAIVVAPQFDAKRFPSRLYQQGGILTKDGTAVSAEERTYAIVPKIVAAVREWEGRPDMPFYLIGHSGGGQFLVRFAGFQTTEAKRIVAANAGTHLFPTTDLPYPYGFGKLPDELASDDVLRKYLAQPLTIYLGTKDDKPDENFDASPNASKQGGSRHARGHAVYEQAKTLAKQKGWPFNWTLVEAEGVAHSAKNMFDHPNCDVALFGKKPGTN